MVMLASTYGSVGRTMPICRFSSVITASAPFEQLGVIRLSVKLVPFRMANGYRLQ
jgi:hypothetical protein